MNNYKNKTVLITGASKGVGAETAKQFAKLGANVALVARNKAPLEALAAEINQYGHAAVFPCDIGEISSLETLVTQVVATFGAIDVLVNNAGLHHRGDFEKLTPVQVSNMVNVNLNAPLTLTHLCLDQLKQSNNGAVIMVGSLAGRAPLQGAAVYSATKAALRAFSYALHDELKPHQVKVAVVSPGPIDTGFIMDEIDHVEDIVYSQPMSSALEVANEIIALSINDSEESAMPWFSGKLTTLAYLFPKLRRALRPYLYKKGAKAKLKYKSRR
ncbi:SDR family NAD(P)-dependent oxidoreductase [Pseudoalteromonas spongiae]|uniref:SDR family NAD(P)-dependent oxidoreductase n=1 Tax=Pseudoalteromonas spongiae TaxID=298657 RepID=UPI0020172403|nr:SDR family NAD(P)-dependent oxidoreductase [Pseudoalteromonas spongiae]